MTEDDLIAIVKMAEDRADREWWNGGRTDIPDGLRIDEKNHRRRAAIIRALYEAMSPYAAKTSP